ncbi:hypothetical protein [Streptomyces viridochromogenes]|nr:hypothetical protein [Streptomyces viridochromogenes]
MTTDFEAAELSRDTPTWVQHTAGIWTRVRLLLLGALFVTT